MADLGDEALGTQSTSPFLILGKKKKGIAEGRKAGSPSDRKPPPPPPSLAQGQDPPLRRV